jgi:hypothetical protein
MPNHFRYLCEHPKYQHGVIKFAKKNSAGGEKTMTTPTGIAFY